MVEERSGRYEVLVEEAAPAGGLFELEQTIFYQVLDTQTREVVYRFRGEIEASLSRENGMWDDFRYSGVRAVIVAPDERSVLVSYHDGREETVPLPQPTCG